MTQLERLPVDLNMLHVSPIESGRRIADVAGPVRRQERPFRVPGIGPRVFGVLERDPGGRVELPQLLTGGEAVAVRVAQAVERLLHLAVVARFAVGASGGIEEAEEYVRHQDADHTGGD